MTYPREPHAIGERNHLLDLLRRWSRRWYDDPALGTEVLLGGGLVEVHVGRGIWQTVATSGV